MTGVTRRQREKDIEGIVPPGTVTAYAGPIASFVPEGWLQCNGGSVRKDKYPRLFRAIGYTYGGSGEDFTLPSLLTRFPAGAGAADSNLAANGAGGAHSTAGGHEHAEHTIASNTAIAGAANRAQNGSHDTAGSHAHNTHNFTDGSVPPYLRLNWIIKT